MVIIVVIARVIIKGNNGGNTKGCKQWYKNKGNNKGVKDKGNNNGDHSGNKKG